MNLVYQWKDTTLTPSFDHDNTYNEIWGYASNGREYAIIGSTEGTHIFDITDVNNVDTVEFIPGRAQGDQIIHRDYDTYQDYLYIVADEGASSLQIADLTFLPDSAPVVYDDDALIIQSHNIFIDTVSGYLYTCGGVTNMGPNYLSVFSLSANPLNPQLAINCSFSVPFWNSTINYVHDIYVKNDTAFCNAGLNGLYIMDFSNLANVQVLGSLTTYTQQGYNHSGWLHSSGNYYAFADETHGLDVKLIDVNDLANLTIIDTIGSNVNQGISIPHNLIFRGDNLFVSFYFDGIYAFNTSDPNNISLAGYYDTSTRPHLLNIYQGNWGVYPFLPSGKILASDMQEGLFVLEPNFNSVSESSSKQEFSFIVFPNPSSEIITIITTLLNEETKYSITDIEGRIVKNGFINNTQTKVNINDFSSGVYHISLAQRNGNIVTKKIIKN
jgi:choice-of-anchor B domain-containing protein